MKKERNEKEYMDKRRMDKDAKKRNKKGKKKGKKVLGALVLVLIALLALGFLIGKYGFGLGTGLGLGEGEKSTQQEYSYEEATSGKSMVAVSVVENDYLYDNKKYSLDDLIAKLKEKDDICVEITSDNAALKAYNNLTDALKNNKIEYVEKSKK